LHRRLLLATYACFLACAAACADPAAQAGRVVFHDDFDAENGMVPRADYHAFGKWEVASGSVDLQGTYPFAYLPPGHGMYVDLDGSRGHGGRLRTRAAFALEPGEYLLRFRLAGTQWVSAPNTVEVSLGSLYHETVTLAPYAPMQRFERRVRVARATRARIEFAQRGGDDMGLLLDDVELIRQ
jgi:hypothetical protein